jgi:drug/metabolite transporter (DMT)-like permease
MSLDTLIIITISCWGIWGIFDKLALQTASHRDVLLMLFVLFVPQVPLVWLLVNATAPGWHPTWEVWFWTGLAASAYTLSMLAYLQAMSKAEASYVLGITASYPLVLQLLAVALLGEHLVVTRMLGAALIGAGVFAIGVSKGRMQVQLATGDRLEMIVCIIIATLCWGVYGILDKKALSYTGPIEVYFTQCLWDVAYLFVVAAVFHLNGHRIDLTSLRAWRFSGLSALMLMIGAWTYLSALSQSTASYVVVITGCYPLLMYGFALLFLKETFNRVRFSGIALVVAGGILVQLTKTMS